MQIPISPETTEAFAERIASTLRDPSTHVYFDTSFLMWLTTIGPVSRKEFFDWESTFKDRCHILPWAMHEFYGHHSDRTLPRKLNESSAKLVGAVKAFANDVRPHSDRQLMPGLPEAAYREAFRTASDRIRELASLATGWDYEASASETLFWMNAHACDVDATFATMPTLRAYGRGRFMQRVPPGYEDQGKKERDGKGSNRFGDLLFWEEVIVHAGMTNAKGVIVVTNDRKKDWYYRLAEAEVDETLKQLKSKWDPVPVPHPTLTFELKTKAKSARLDLLDQVYLGAIVWKEDRAKFGRFAGVAVDQYASEVDQFAKPATPPVPRPQKRLDPSTIGMMQAEALVNAAFAPLDAIVISLLARLDDEAKAVDSFVDNFAPADLAALDPGQIVSFARQSHDRSILGGPMATSLSSKLLRTLDEFTADVAASVYLGLAVSAYYHGAVARERPAGHLVAELFYWQTDQALPVILKALGRRLKKDRSPALYIPNPENRRVVAIVEHDISSSTTPAELREVYFGDRALLKPADPRRDRQLRTYLDGKQEATVEGIVHALCSYYGVPVELTDTVGCHMEELRSIPELMGLAEFDRFALGALQGGLDLQPEAETAEDEDDEFDIEQEEEDEGE
jgi:hypothetical protein